MTELEIFLLSSIENILYLHNDGSDAECICGQCKLARQTLSVAQQSDGGEVGHDLDISSPTYKRLVELREKSSRR